MRKVKFQASLLKIRKARVNDIPQLLEVENRCFSYDQLGRRNFHWMIKKANSILKVLDYDGKIVGYGLVLINNGTSLARLYSICTLEEYQGHGLASKLISILEKKAADDEDCAYMRLEVKDTNLGAIKLYEKLGYSIFSTKKDYYEDGGTALCFEKRIRNLKRTAYRKVPYYQQGTDFTCGPASLLMAMKAFNPKTETNLSAELQIWREATTIFMTSGHGGCGPHGLALSAWRRGYRSEVYLSHTRPLFVDSVRSPEKKEIISLVHKDFEKKTTDSKIKIHRKRITIPELQGILDNGGIPLVLITTYHFDSNRSPHWVVVTALDNSFVYIHDPDQDSPEEYKGAFSRIHIPIPVDQFIKISRWGKDKISATVAIYTDK